MSTLLELNDNNFEEEVVSSSVPVLVDIYADWCGPCRMLSPIMEDLKNKFSDRLKVCKANMEKNQGMISRYCVSSVPTLLFFRNGDIIEKIVGLKKKEDIERNIEAILC